MHKFNHMSVHHIPTPNPTHLHPCPAQFQSCPVSIGPSTLAIEKSLGPKIERIGTQYIPHKILLQGAPFQTLNCSWTLLPHVLTFPNCQVHHSEQTLPQIDIWSQYNSPLKPLQGLTITKFKPLMNTTTSCIDFPPLSCP